MAEEVAEIFSKHIFSSKYEDLSEKTIKQLKVFLLDTIQYECALSHCFFLELSVFLLL